VRGASVPSECYPALYSPERYGEEDRKAGRPARGVIELIPRDIVALPPLKSNEFVRRCLQTDRHRGLYNCHRVREF
jgi:hypothetical protein